MPKTKSSASMILQRVAAADLVIVAIDFFVLMAVSLDRNSPQTIAMEYFPAILLLEAAICFIIGGLPPFLSTFFSRIRSHFPEPDQGSSIGGHEENERTALFIILLGVFLLLESFGASLLFL